MKMQSDRITEALKFLSGFPLFSDLSENTRGLVARTSKFQHFEKGRILFFQSDLSEWAYIVRSGSISIVLSNPDGRDMVINEMRPGDIFGELGILPFQPPLGRCVGCKNTTDDRPLMMKTAQQCLNFTREKINIEYV